MADELSRVACTLKWSRNPDKREFGKLAKMANTAGCLTLGDLRHSTAADRDLLYQLLLTPGAGCARAMRMISWSRAGTQSQPKKQCSFREVDISAEINTDPTLKGVGEILLPRRGSASLFSADFCGRRAAYQRENAVRF